MLGVRVKRLYFVKKYQELLLKLSQAIERFKYQKIIDIKWDKVDAKKQK